MRDTAALPAEQPCTPRPLPPSPRHHSRASTTPSVHSTPRSAGRQCMKRACGPAAFIRSSLTWVGVGGGRGWVAGSSYRSKSTLCKPAPQPPPQRPPGAPCCPAQPRSRHLEALEALAPVVGLVLLPHARPHVCGRRGCRERAGVGNARAPPDCQRGAKGSGSSSSAVQQQRTASAPPAHPCTRRPPP